MSLFRITAGTYRGKKLFLPPEDITRPTSTRTRQALFNCLFSLNISIQDCTFLDGFAGSGAIGLEALSRGAKFCSFIENHPRILPLLKRNIQDCRCEETSEIQKDFKALKRIYDIIYLDPPYGGHKDGVPLYLTAIQGIRSCLHKESIIIIETSSSDKEIKKNLETHGLKCILEKTYGAAALYFTKASET